MKSNPNGPSLCISNCNSTQYFDQLTSSCKSCSTSCSTCILSPTQCLSCKTLEPAKYLKNSSCLSDCGDRFYGDSISKECRGCHTTCLRCSGPNANQCTSCNPSSMNRFFYQGECLNLCPATVIQNLAESKCEPCPSTCTACNNDGCTVCPGGNPPFDGKCKLICPEGQVWVAPNNCESCDSKCDFCSDITKACNINLSYQLKLPELLIGKKTEDTTMQIELHLFREGGKAFSLDQVISQTLSGSCLKLRVKSSSEVLPFTIEITPLNTIVLKVQKPAQIPQGEVYFVQGFEPSLISTYKDLVSNIQTNFILVQNQDQEVEILNNQLPSESVESATSTGSTVSSVTGSLGVTTDILGVLGVVMSADQTGATLKFSQISKLISRLRYVDVNFGQIFGGFLNGLGNAFDKKTSFDASTAFNDKEGEELQETIEHATKRIKLQDKLSNGRKGKFNTYLVDFFLIGKTDKGWMDRLLVEDEANKIRESPASDSGSEDRTLVASAVAATTAKPIPSGFIFGQFMEEIKYWIYLVSWINKIIVMKLVGHRKETGEVTPGFFSYVTFSQKIHFVLFNLVSIDVVFLGTRTILHTKISRSIGFLYMWTLVVYNLVILDLLEIAYLSATLVYSTYKQIQKATGKEVVAQEDEKKQVLDKKHDDSIHSLKKHEVSKESFARENLAKTGGLRKWFRDEDVCETGGLIKPDQAQKLGYIRVVDSFKTMSFLSMNLAVIEHATGEIKPNEKVFDFKTVMMSNFAFIVRVILYHIFIVALANQPGMLIISLILLESFYIFMIVKNFLILRYLVSVHLFIAKVVQSFFMLIFHLISLIMFLSNGPTSAV